MPDLEKLILDWRQRMLGAGIETPVPLDELESHLREDMERQLRSGVGVAQAFESSVRRIGPVAALTTEFAKVSGPKEARRKKLAARCFAALIGLYTLGVGSLLTQEGELSNTERLLGFAGLGMTALMAYAGWRLMPRLVPVIPNRVIRKIFQLAGGVAGVAWVFLFAGFVLPRFEFTLGQLAVALIWGFIPALVMPTAFVGFDKVEGRQIAAADWQKS